MTKLSTGVFIGLMLSSLAIFSQQLPPAVGADQSFQGLEGVRAPHDRPEKPLGPAGPSSKYPVNAVIISGHSTYFGNHTYKGDGAVQLAGRSYDFRFNCADRFLTTGVTYVARWSKQDRKLEILLAKPGSKGTRSCDLKTAGI